MKVTLIVLGCLLALILLLLALRIGVLAEYSEHGVLVRVRAGPIRITLIPKRKKKKARKEKKDKKSRKTRKEKWKPLLRKEMKEFMNNSEISGKTRFKCYIQSLMPYIYGKIKFRNVTTETYWE